MGSWRERRLGAKARLGVSASVCTGLSAAPRPGLPPVAAGAVAVIVRSPEHGERFRRMAREAAVVRVWDLPTRLFHWALASGVVAAIVSAQLGGEAMTWHMRFGYAIFTLLAFRLAWGFVGGRWSRFARSSTGRRRPCATCAARAAPHEHHDVGHTPLGAWSVLALLAVLAAPGRRPGSSPTTRSPTPARCSSTSRDATSAAASHWHRLYGQWIIIGLALLHIGAVAVLVAALAQEPGRADAARRQGARRRRAGRARQRRFAPAGAGAGRRSAPSRVALIARLGD